MDLSASAAISPIPRTYREALADPNWYSAMLDEYKALMANNTWSLVPRVAGANVVTGKWLFRHKLNPDGSLARYKARWVVRGCSQQAGVDYGETLSPVIKPATIRTVLSLAVSEDWPIHQLDVKNAFLHGTLTETVLAQQPSGFVGPSYPKHVCRLNKSLYGLKQAPRTWFLRFTNFLFTMGFHASKSDPSLFIQNKAGRIAYLLLYVDDIILTANSMTLLTSIINSLCCEFSMSPLQHFLGINVTRTAYGLFLSQDQYATDILECAKMVNCNPSNTPVDTKQKPSAQTGKPVPDGTEYRSLAGALQYLTLTRPDISFAVQQICLFMHDPRDTHMQLLKRVLLTMASLSPSHPVIVLLPTLTPIGRGVRTPVARHLGTGVFLGDNIVAWSSKQQQTVSRSSAEAEYRGVANAVAELCWLRQLVTELHRPPKESSIVYCDNVSTMYMHVAEPNASSTHQTCRDIPTCTSYGTELLLATSKSYTFHQLFSSRMSSRRDCQDRCLKISVPAYTCNHLQAEGGLLDE
ncbi:hypothetical protein U9M48_041519 [Paspalum notatum var. saurae]|uniref:Reverse transcriptase Ty1/copia-type domain-containing protein n=1 Tax=Paspalum notatum var. saurae TaxID=547442 RepID=A0AAQ3XFC3_PASNO